MEVALERPIYQSVSLVDMSEGLIDYYASARELSDEVRAAIAELRGYKAEVQAREIEISRLRNDYRTIVEDQARIRDNLDSIPRDTDLYRRYIDDLSGQEEQLDQLAVAIAEAEEALIAARDELGDYARAQNL